MKTKKAKPTNKDFQRVVQNMGMDIFVLRTQLNALSEIVSDYLDFTDTRKSFEEFLKERTEKTLETQKDINP